MKVCQWADCWCRDYRNRVIPSVDLAYTVEEVEPGLYRYAYAPVDLSRPGFGYAERGA